MNHNMGNELTKLLGKEIKKIRKNRNLTQEEFGEELGILQPVVSRLESGKQMNGIVKLVKLLEKVNIGINILVIDLDQELWYTM